MEHSATEKFDIQSLLRFGYLHVKDVANKNPDLSANDYFTKIDLFLQNESREIEELLSINDNGKNEYYIKILVEYKETLLEIGEYFLPIEIDYICQAIRENNWSDALRLKEDFLNKIITLYARLNSIYLSKPLNKKTDADSENSILLSELIEKIEYEEKTRKLRILVVDDMPIFVNTIMSILSEEYEVFGLTKAAQVEKFLERTIPELFLIDIEMPDISGFDLIPIIRQFKEHQDTPIILLTGHSTKDYVKEAFSYGVSDFISKPVNSEVLLEKVQSKIIRKKDY